MENRVPFFPQRFCVETPVQLSLPCIGQGGGGGYGAGLAWSNIHSWQRKLH